ncbi:MAG: hypothetical protein IT463_03070 [Planctomycetes bacterium]|nr:hypothetical protein [Planctomycetota bacterium]
MRSGGEFMAWWMDLPWWLRWLICLIPLGIAVGMLASGKFWPWGFAVGGILTLINLFLSWGEILDRFFPRRK